ncbi:MAG: DoxX family protein [Actinobacteria bacterium]|nr:DoxX family protein [Actinomycetota bacterium]
MFLGSGVIHFVKPQPFVSIVPRMLPKPLWMVYMSGAAELVCAVGLLARARWSGSVSAALLVAVLPANVRHALDVTARSESSGRWEAVLAWARVPVQIPLIWAALQNRRA